MAPARLRPFRRFDVLRRVHRIESDVAETAGHADEVRRFHLAGTLEIGLGVPVGLVELRIREASQADDARGIAGDSWHLRLFALIHPQAVLIGGGSRAASRLRDSAERREAPAVEARVDVGEQVDVAFRQLRHPHPELLVAAGPEIPGVAAGTLRVGQIAVGVAIVGLVLRCGRSLRAPQDVATGDRENCRQPHGRAHRHRGSRADAHAPRRSQRCHRCPPRLRLHGLARTWSRRRHA